MNLDPTKMRSTVIFVYGSLTYLPLLVAVGSGLLLLVAVGRWRGGVAAIVGVDGVKILGEPTCPVAVGQVFGSGCGSAGGGTGFQVRIWSRFWSLPEVRCKQMTTVIITITTCSIIP